MMVLAGSWARAAQQASLPAAAATAGAAKHSVWDGVYTEDQAQRGKELYAAHCLACHGENLEGNGPVKALTGPDFAAKGGVTWIEYRVPMVGGSRRMCCRAWRAGPMALWRMGRALGMGWRRRFAPRRRRKGHGWR